MDRTTLVADSGCEFDTVSDHNGDSLVEQSGVGTDKHDTAEQPVLLWLCLRTMGTEARTGN